MVYCAAFGCNANTNKNIVTCRSSKFPPQPTLLKKWLAKIKSANFKPTNNSRLCSAHFEKPCFDGGAEKMAVLC